MERVLVQYKSICRIKPHILYVQNFTFTFPIVCAYCGIVSPPRKQPEVEEVCGNKVRAADSFMHSIHIDIMLVVTYCSKKSASFMKVSGTPLSTASSSRPVSRRLASRQRRLQSTSSSQIQHVPVDQLIFLHSRMRAKVKGAGILVSSEAGVANFWDLFGKLNPVGMLQIPMVV